MAENKSYRWPSGRPRSNNPRNILAYSALSPEEIAQVVEEHNADISRLSINLEKRSAARCEILEDKSTYYVQVTPEFNRSFAHNPYLEEKRMPENEQRDLEWWKSRLDRVQEIALGWARKRVGTDKPMELVWYWPIIEERSGARERLERLGLDTKGKDLNLRQFLQREYMEVAEIPVYRNTFSFSAGPFRYERELQTWSLDEKKIKRCNKACQALVAEAYEQIKDKD